MLRKFMVSLLVAILLLPVLVATGCSKDKSADGGQRDVPVQGPEEDIEVFLSGSEAIEYAIEEEGLFLEAALEQAEVAAVELDPEAGALQVLQPAGSQIAPPVVLHPAANGRLSQIAAGLFTFKPFIKLGFFFAFGVDATLFHNSSPGPHSRTAVVLPFSIRVQRTVRAATPPTYRTLWFSLVQATSGAMTHGT